ncbi:MAG: CDP-diacylglycerol--glycerol-3-phosphate 3-phosphatidyltransferase [Verrucomicrobia bacterium CG_4_9_14_3_um_filter_43_20]|nr:MAG: CDP-diacylglycerol--glycerol-3-phosphate 3-phosphatidyltransferase [Verrucomicrobia bacterium CG1_02_43_26]PIP58877.1 MAG: CDP-diacylglycerol--glycerol-3-phosphate 3-phosphatidyltransferase [Verrucomicrobia bacterium CG22_combo_CG10-13_8_21_14_all_43_17]PJA44249.1 MAG: CDP-diacylglycerol--glycerol-3-phosphate 3-phosphatidyltransferase [Verrucomicrobia bacterium CG_4_9_14_3_um_filter_43_20]
MNLPNAISFSRIPLLFVIAALLYCSWMGAATIAFILFVIGGLSDWLDGYLARKNNNISNFGKILDALTDKIFVLGVIITLLAIGILPNWSLFLVLIILGREFLITGLRLIAASHGTILAAERGGKIKTLIQLFSVGTLICDYAFVVDYGRWINLQFIEIVYYCGLGLFVLATLLTLQSGFYYIQKYKHLFLKNPL